MPDSPVTSLLARLGRDPGRPRLTWYGDEGERVELSGAVLANWVTKTANLLVEELDAGPGFRVRLDLPGHWRAVVWALGVWRVGACVVAGAPDGRPADTVVTTRPSSHPGAVPVAVALPALARAFPGELPPGAVDGSAVLSYGDALGWVPAADLAAPALEGSGGAVSHADVVPADGTADRLLVDAADAPPDAVLRRVLAALAADGSVVLVGGDASARLRADGRWRARLVAGERVTAER